MLKMLDLFSGMAGFSYTADKLGITTTAFCEIDTNCHKVLSHHWPDVPIYTDVCQVNGAEIEPADIVTFGSPCQDLSVAGKREGMDGCRSGLFYEAVRIIQEMRRATNGLYPRFAVWENVLGAFSSNQGADFRSVLEALTEAEIPIPQSGKWADAGLVRGDEREVAWRVLDAQYWGVPQRRKRIFLIADFRGNRAGEILFKPEGLPWDSQESRSAREEAAATVGDGIEKSVYNESGRGWISEGFGCLRCEGENRPSRPTHVVLEGKQNVLTCECCGKVATNLINVRYQEDWLDICSECAMEAKPQGINGRQDPCCYGDKTGSLDTDPLTQCVAQCLTTGTGRRYDAETETLIPVLYDMTHADEVIRPVEAGLSPTLNSRMGTGGNQVPVMLQGTTFAVRTGQTGANGHGVAEEKTHTIDCAQGQAVAFAANQRDEVRDMKDKSGALQAQPGMKQQTFVSTSYAVRRLTPLECLRLQGFPDNWLDIEGLSGSAKYRMIGNSVAIPCVEFVLSGIKREAESNRNQ